MAYVIVNDFDGGTRQQYDAVVEVVHPPGGLPGPPKITEVEVSV
jgi:hypothetical protein